MTTSDNREWIDHDQPLGERGPHDPHRDHSGWCIMWCFIGVALCVVAALVTLVVNR